MARLVFLGCIAYLVVGIGQLVVGTVMEPMVNAYGVQYGDGGQLVMHQFLGGMVGILLAPWLIGKIGKKPLLLTALAVMATAEIVYTMQPSWNWMLVTAPFAGFGFGTTEAVVGAFVIGSAGSNANVAMSRVEVFFSLGALLMPFAGAVLISGGYWHSAFGVVGGLAIAAFAMWFVWWPKILDTPGGYAADAQAQALAASDADRERLRGPEGPGQSGQGRDASGLELGSVQGRDESGLEDSDQLGQGRDASGLGLSRDEKARKPRQRWGRRGSFNVLAACGAFFAIYVGLEMSFLHYLPSLLVQNGGVADSTASLSLSVFWGAMTVGRLVSGQAADRWGGAAYLLATCVAALGFFVWMGGMEGVVGLYLLTFAAGLAMSGMFSVALVFANRAAPGMTEKTTSLLMACGGIGGALLPRVTGWFLDGNGPSATWWLFAIYAMIMLVVAIWAAMAARSSRLRTDGAQAAARSI